MKTFLRTEERNKLKIKILWLSVMYFGTNSFVDEKNTFLSKFIRDGIIIHDPEQ